MKFNNKLFGATPNIRTRLFVTKNGESWSGVEAGAGMKWNMGEKTVFSMNIDHIESKEFSDTTLGANVVRKF